MYHLVFDEADKRASYRAVDLEAKDTAEVLAYLERQHVQKPVELWRQGECLGHIRRSSDHGAKFWRVT
jgi:hypothetical protein